MQSPESGVQRQAEASPSLLQEVDSPSSGTLDLQEGDASFLYGGGGWGQRRPP